MKTAEILLQQSKQGSTVILKGVTPFEALILTAEHHANVGKPPVTIMTSTEEERDDLTEVSRLREKYGSKKVDMCLQKVMNKLPVDFDKVAAIGTSFQLSPDRMSQLPDFKV